MRCKFCSSTDITFHGNRRNSTSWKQRYYCKTCKRRFTPDIEPEEHEQKQGVRILVLDIETAPMSVFTFNLRTDYIPASNVITPTFMLSWAASWLEIDGVMGDVVTSKEARNQNDSRIVRSIHSLISQADIVISYNGDKFDIPGLNTRFLVNGLQPPSEFRSLDPYKTYKYQFRFDSNKLDYTNRMLGLEQKTPTDFQLWIDCYHGDIDALQEMFDYNKKDVVILKSNYKKLRPWMKRHPNLGVYFDHDGEMCRVCGSTNVREVLDKWHYTNVGKYPLYRCSDCGAESVGRTSELSKEKRKGLIK